MIDGTLQKQTLNIRADTTEEEFEDYITLAGDASSDFKITVELIVVNIQT